MDEFMIDLVNFQENVLNYETGYNRLKSQKELIKIEENSRGRKIEETKKALKEQKKSLKKRLDAAEKSKKSIKNPFELRRFEEGEIKQLREQEEELISQERNIDAAEAEYAEYKASIEQQIAETEKELTEGFQAFISNTLKEIKTKKENISKQLNESAISMLEEKRDKLQKEKEAHLEHISKLPSGDGIKKHLEEVVVPRLDSQIEGLDREIQAKSSETLEDNWKKLDAFKNLLEKMQPKEQERKPSRRKQKRMAITTYEILNGLSDIQKEIDEIDPELKNKLLDVSIRVEKERFNNAIKTAKAERDRKKALKEEYEAAKKAAMKAKAEREAAEAEAEEPGEPISNDENDGEEHDDEENQELPNQETVFDDEDYQFLFDKSRDDEEEYGEHEEESFGTIIPELDSVVSNVSGDEEPENVYVYDEEEPGSNLEKSVWDRDFIPYKNSDDSDHNNLPTDSRKKPGIFGKIAGIGAGVIAAVLAFLGIKNISGTALPSPETKTASKQEASANVKKTRHQQFTKTLENVTKGADKNIEKAVDEVFKEIDENPEIADDKRIEQLAEEAIKEANKEGNEGTDFLGRA